MEGWRGVHDTILWCGVAVVWCDVRAGVVQTHRKPHRLTRYPSAWTGLEIHQVHETDVTQPGGAGVGGSLGGGRGKGHRVDAPREGCEGE